MLNLINISKAVDKFDLVFSILWTSRTRTELHLLPNLDLSSLRQAVFPFPCLNINSQDILYCMAKPFTDYFYNSELAKYPIKSSSGKKGWMNPNTTTTSISLPSSLISTNSQECHLKSSSTEIHFDKTTINSASFSNSKSSNFEVSMLKQTNSCSHYQYIT